jgi:hypothetical protein
LCDFFADLLPDAVGALMLESPPHISLSDAFIG